jgi:hypothetical protein
MFDLEWEDEAETFMPVEQFARYMNITPERVRQLMKLRVLRTRYAWGGGLVQPALVSGHTA